jgi:predicted ATPase/class 3 adenylate cyclase
MSTSANPADRPPPTGTVTFLFTDIEGSTRLAQEYPGALPGLIARHNAILQKSIEASDGYVFQIIGDAFCAAFHTATDALHAALAAQQDLQQAAWDPAPILVRMGIHTGAAQISDMEDRSGGYRGYMTMACAQRVMSSAHGGQVLLSGASAELVRGQLLDGVTLRDMGEHRLKGLDNPQHLWQMVAGDLRAEFPPILSIDTIPNNLPPQPTAFIGRDTELGEIVKRLSSTDVRLLTLTGPGGIGQTRLALRAAAELLERFEDGIYFVDLAPIRDPEAVPTAIGRTLGLRETSDRPLLDELKELLRTRKMLLLLDNFEQVTAAANKVGDLLRDCPKLSLMVTSREALRVRGEYVYPVPPLAMPRLELKPSLEQLTQYEAVRLFIERAQAVKPEFTVTNENAPAVAEICWRLDGLPLAIELAAARIRMFSPQALLERLGSRLKMLRGGARDLPARQQTLRDAIDWSYELLDVSEQRLFQMLAVFQGCTFEAVEATAGGIEGLDGRNMDVLDVLSSLLDKSLIRQVSLESEEPRLLMLETIREFAIERLDEDLELRAAARRAHATYYANFTERQWERLNSNEREAALLELVFDIENVRAAWRYWVEERDLQKLGKFVDSLWLLFDARGWYHSTIDLITDMLTVLSFAPLTPERIQQEILLQTSLARALQVIKGNTAEVEQAYTRALELSQQVGDIPELFPVLRGLGSLYGYIGQFDKANQVAMRLLSMAERLDDPAMQAEGHLRVGYSLAFTGGIQQGLEHLEMALAGYDAEDYATPRFQLGNNSGVVGLNVSALLLWMVGFPERALERAKAAVALARRLKHPYSLAYAHFHAGLLHLWRREAELAQEGALAVLDIAGDHDFQVWSAVATCLQGAALAGLGQAPAGMVQVRQGIDAYQGLNTPPVFWPLLIFMQAEVSGRAGKPEQGLAVLAKASEITGAASENVLSVEFYRLTGDLLLAHSIDNQSEAEQYYLRALDLAREKRVSMMELRAAVCLSRLWQGQRKAEQGKRMLSDVYGRFTEGFTTADLIEAR